MSVKQELTERMLYFSSSLIHCLQPFKSILIVYHCIRRKRFTRWNSNVSMHVIALYLAVKAQLVIIGRALQHCRNTGRIDDKVACGKQM